jgi:hypothetical protein
MIRSVHGAQRAPPRSNSSNTTAILIMLRGLFQSCLFHFVSFEPRRARLRQRREYSGR